MKLLAVYLQLILLFFIPSSAYGNEDELRLYTEDDPPFNYQDKGEIKGASVDLLLEIFNRMGIKKGRKDIVFLPWPRGMRETQRHANIILFSTKRTKEREALFKWVGPISSASSVLIARKETIFELESDKKFNDYIYGATKDEMGAIKLLEAGVKPEKIVPVHFISSAVYMLNRGRIDAWSRDWGAASWTIKNLGFHIQDYKVVHIFAEEFHYFALNKNTDNTFINKMQETLENLYHDGSLAKINTSYNITYPHFPPRMNTHTQTAPHVAD